MPMRSFNNLLRVHFKSNEILNYAGFVMTYSVIEGNIYRNDATLFYSILSHNIGRSSGHHR